MPFKLIDTKFQLANASGQSWLCKSEMLRSGAKAAAIRQSQQRRESGSAS
jgi:hypothetical protein